MSYGFPRTNTLRFCQVPRFSWSSLTLTQPLPRVWKTYSKRNKKIVFVFLLAVNKGVKLCRSIGCALQNSLCIIFFYVSKTNIPQCQKLSSPCKGMGKVIRSSLTLAYVKRLFPDQTRDRFVIYLKNNNNILHIFFHLCVYRFNQSTLRMIY